MVFKLFAYRKVFSICNKKRALIWKNTRVNSGYVYKKIKSVFTINHVSSHLYVNLIPNLFVDLLFGMFGSWIKEPLQFSKNIFTVELFILIFISH